MLRRLDDNRTPRGAHPGIDDPDVHAVRQERNRLGQERGATAHIAGGNSVRDVEDSNVGCETSNNTVADRYERVLVAVVREQAYPWHKANCVLPPVPGPAV